MKHRIGMIGWLGVLAAALSATGTASAQTTLTQECTPEGGAVDVRTSSGTDTDDAGSR